MRLALALLVAHVCTSLGADNSPSFGLTNLWTVELRVTPDSWRAVLESRTFTRATVIVNGLTFTNVAVRQKGGGTASGTREGRPPLRVVFKGQSVAGVQKLSLNNNFFDGSYLRDVLSYKLCRDFGVAAPKTAFAKIYLRIDGTALRYLGLYTATEIVDEEFLADRFGPDQGVLMKPTLPTFMNGGRWPNEVRGLDLEAKPTAEESERLLAFLKLVNDRSNRAFQQEIGSYLDVDNFLRFIVVNVALSNLDSFLGMGKNFYLYLDPRTSRLTFIPWDFDLSFGGFFLCGTPEQRIRMSIDTPSDDRLLMRLLANPEVKERYHALLGEFLEKHFNPAHLEKLILELAALIEPAVMEEKHNRLSRFKANLDSGEHGLLTTGWHVDIALKQFIDGRARSLAEQLAGTSPGERPRFRLRHE